MLKTLLDRPFINKKNPILDKMILELSLYMNPMELDRLIDFMWTLENSEQDINYTVNDCETQLRIILGSERYETIRDEWKAKNQKMLSVYGTLKYKCKKTGKLYDGLDDTDNEEDYEKYYV